MTDSFPDPRFMDRALSLARRGVGRTSPNPAVGCVIVRHGEIVGEGWHRRAGTPHAEVHALAEAREMARGGDLYVTLEPCSHHGRTPPCCEAIVRAGVRRVVAAVVDPNPLVSGQGISFLREHGIETLTGLREAEARRLNAPFFSVMERGIPLVTFKSAATLDGAIAASSGDSRWITEEPARRHAHRLRSRHDAVMVGVGTVIADDPLLTCRIRGGRQPIRVIVDSRLRTPATSRVVTGAKEIRTVIACIDSDPQQERLLADRGVEILRCREDEGMVDLVDLLRALSSRGVQSVLVEGGGRLAGALFARGVVSRVALFYAPKLLAKEGIPMIAGERSERISEALALSSLSIRRIGSDLLVEGEVEYGCSPV